ncbi:MAG: GtrA family protein [Bacteroidales bacterium]|nr:GtrA family protein [Bacteroidales bacterium]
MVQYQLLWRRFFKFCVVGVSGTAIDFGITAVCKGLLGVPELLSNAMGFTVAATTNFIFNRIWTWKSTSKKVGAEYLKFFAVSVVGLGINTLMVLVLHNRTVVPCPAFASTCLNLDWDFWVAKVVATAVVMMWNFLANNFFTFRKINSE